MNIHHKIANIFGYDLINVKKNHPTIGSHLSLLFESMGIDLVLDVGANNGGFGRMIRGIGYKGDIVSFEPVRRSFEAISKLGEKDDRWIVFNYALGSEEAELDINVPSSDDFSSFLEVSEYAKGLWKKEFSVVKKEKVKVNKLDNVFDHITRHFPGAENIFLKMDTQGYDLEVLKGADEVLKHIKALQSEVSILPIYDNMPDYLESMTLFREKGFELTGLYPVSRYIENLLLVEMDCVMRRVK